MDFQVKRFQKTRIPEKPGKVTCLGLCGIGGKELENMNFTKMEEQSAKKIYNAWIA